MKSAGFFIEKAKEYIAQIDQFLDNYIDHDFKPRTEFNTSPGDALPSRELVDGYAEQQSEISTLKTKIKLLILEFDHGAVFLSEINDMENSTYTRAEPKDFLIAYKKTLELFIEHLTLFRS